MEPVGARTARAMAPIVAPAGPGVAASRPAAATIWSSSNFGGRATDKRIYVLIQRCQVPPVRISWLRPETRAGPRAFPGTPRELERPTGFEPATSSLGSWHSATELRPRSKPILAFAPPKSNPLTSNLLLERHVVGLDQLVAPRLPVEALACAVEVDLLVERHRRL